MHEYHGLKEEEVARLLRVHGPNMLVEKKKSFLVKFFKWAISPISLMLLAAATLSFVAGNTFDMWVILVLFLSNFFVSMWHEAKADKSIEKLKEHLMISVKVFRDEVWKRVDSSQLVPGDIVELAIGGVVPADMFIFDAKNLSINESILTGESFPKQKNVGDQAFSGSFVATGRALGRVSATGVNTFFGKTISLVDTSARRSELESDILSISKSISVVSVVVIIFLTIVLLAAKASIVEIVTLDLSLLIAGIPIALPTVMSLIISIGVLGLAKKSVVVRRMASLEDLANVDLLLSDKTGTLTENKITIEKIVPFDGFAEREVVALAVSTVTSSEGDSLAQAVVETAKKLRIDPYEQIETIPGDSERKRSTARIVTPQGDKTVSLGAAQVIASLCNLGSVEKSHFENLVADAANQGYRVHVLSVKDGSDEKNMKLAGIFFLADQVRADAAGTIKFMNRHGVDVKMLTGDNMDISKRVAAELGLAGEIFHREKITDSTTWDDASLSGIAGFAEVLPKDKYDAVLAAEKHHVVAVTGDGVNDLPAVKAASVGFAVKNAVDALKSTADIVLLTSGISVIESAILEARKIFARLYNYSVYRISESLRVVITIAVIGFLYQTYPVTPVQLILLAFLNDAPIISLAFDRVKSSLAPAHINTRERFLMSSLFGLVGVANSLLMLFIADKVLHLPWAQIQTIFFLKLTVSGHMLIYVAHTRERWWKFLPSKQVIIATILTQVFATLLALFGIFTAGLSPALVVFIWVWAFFWMQIAEFMKPLQSMLSKYFLQKGIFSQHAS